MSLLKPGAMIVACACLWGCHTSVTQMTPARAVPAGDFEVGVNMSGGVYPGVVPDAIDAAKSAGKAATDGGTTNLTEEQSRDLIEGVAAFALLRPSVASELTVRYGITDRILKGLDAGIRYNGTLVKADVKLQLWGSERYAVSLDVGYAHHLDVAGSLLETVSFTEFGRYDVDASLLLGMELGDWFKGSIAPRFLYSSITATPKFSQEVLARIPPSYQAFEPSQYFQDATMLYYGATLSLMLGYKWIYVVGELSAFAVSFEPEIFGQKADLNDVLIAPAVGLLAKF